jgi:hypothetical protein
MSTKIAYIKTELEKSRSLLKKDVMINKKNKGEVKWIATYDSIDVIFANLKRTIGTKNCFIELDKLIIAIKNHKFESQFKLFVKFYTNSQYNSQHINIGHCPQISKKIPYNKNNHTKEYFIFIIIDWYTSYFEWDKKNIVQKKDFTIKNDTVECAKIPEPITTSHDEYNPNENREIPDTWDM